VLLSYIEITNCHGFYNNSLVINDEVVNCSLLLNNLDVGALWYPNLHYSQRIEKNGKSMHIRGTFRHIDCTIMFCKFICPLIPTRAYFKRRAWRPSDMVVCRREWSIPLDIHLNYLQYEELITSARELMHVVLKFLCRISLFLEEQPLINIFSINWRQQ